MEDRYDPGALRAFAHDVLRRAHVAAYGGLDPMVTPDPVAAGIPAEPDPILIDMSMSITTAGRRDASAPPASTFPINGCSIATARPPMIPGR